MRGHPPVRQKEKKDKKKKNKKRFPPHTFQLARVPLPGPLGRNWRFLHEIVATDNHCTVQQLGLPICHSQGWNKRKSGTYHYTSTLSFCFPLNLFHSFFRGLSCFSKFSPELLVVIRAEIPLVGFLSWPAPEMTYNLHPKHFLWAFKFIVTRFETAFSYIYFLF